jgi:hypothetical protein
VRRKVWVVQRQQVVAKCHMGKFATGQCGWIGKLPWIELGRHQSRASRRGLHKASSYHMRGKREISHLKPPLTYEHKSRVEAHQHQQLPVKQFKTSALQSTKLQQVSMYSWSKLK